MFLGIAVILTIDESIQKLKTEILAQDWRLPQRRIESLEAAFACLKQRFKSRKSTLAILTMADNVLKYIKKYGLTAEPDFIDFLKESMAHVVTIYEEEKFDPKQEHQLFQRVYEQFGRLRKKIDAARQASTGYARPRTNGQAPRTEKTKIHHSTKKL